MLVLYNEGETAGSEVKTFSLGEFIDAWKISNISFVPTVWCDTLQWQHSQHPYTHTHTHTVPQSAFSYTTEIKTKLRPISWGMIYWQSVSPARCTHRGNWYSVIKYFNQTAITPLCQICVIMRQNRNQSLFLRLLWCREISSSTSKHGQYLCTWCTAGVIE